MRKDKIFIVSDDTVTRQLLHLNLRKNIHYTVCTAKSGEEALKTILSLNKDELPDLVVIDIGMAGVSGLEVVKELKNHPATEKITIIFIISSKNIEHKVQAFQAGGVDYITKPLDVLEITNRIETHLKLNFLINNLEEQVKKRTDKLRKAYKELKVLDEMKDDFISLMSHEFYTPLTAIKSCSETILDYPGIEKESLVQFITEIKAAGDWLFDSIENMILLESLENKKTTYTQEIVDVKYVIDTILVQLKNEIEEKEIDVQCDVQEEEESYFVDINQKLCFKALYNVVHNAIKFSNEKDKVVIKLVKNDQDTTISVTDNGLTIPKKYKKKIFQKFTQIESIQHHSKGLGLGLPITKNIIDRFGGKISFTSQKNKGTTFHIKLKSAKLEL